jgi:hypothetical protein
MSVKFNFRETGYEVRSNCILNVTSNRTHSEIPQFQVRYTKLASHGGGPCLRTGLVKCDLWWTKWRWGRFSPSTSVSPTNLHSTNCSTITPIYHLGLYNRPEVAAVPGDVSPTPRKKKRYTNGRMWRYGESEKCIVSLSTKLGVTRLLYSGDMTVRSTA